MELSSFFFNLLLSMLPAIAEGGDIKATAGQKKAFLTLCFSDTPFIYQPPLWAPSVTMKRFHNTTRQKLIPVVIHHAQHGDCSTDLIGNAWLHTQVSLKPPLHHTSLGWGIRINVGAERGPEVTQAFLIWITSTSEMLKLMSKGPRAKKRSIHFSVLTGGASCFTLVKWLDGSSRVLSNWHT